MACCMAALLFVYQLIHAWQRVRRWCGWPARAANLVQQRFRSFVAPLWAPLPRSAWVVLVAFELGLVGTLAGAHWDHSHQISQALTMTVAAVDSLCTTSLENR
jgi:hypothetical protein